MKKALGNLIRVFQHLGCSYKEVEELSPRGCIITGQGQWAPLASGDILSGYKKKMLH